MAASPFAAVELHSFTSAEDLTLRLDFLLAYTYPMEQLLTPPPYHGGGAESGPMYVGHAVHIRHL